MQVCLSAVRHKVLVMSGKGGVGKSSLAAHLAFALAHSTADPTSSLAQHTHQVPPSATGMLDEQPDIEGLQVGLLDVDICGPSIPTLTVRIPPISASLHMQFILPSPRALRPLSYMPTLLR